MASYTQESLEKLTIPEIKALSAKLGYSITKAKKADIIAEFLEQQPQVEYVNYPGLPSNKYYALAQKYLGNGGCGVVSFNLKGGRQAAEEFMKRLQLAAQWINIQRALIACGS